MRQHAKRLLLGGMTLTLLSLLFVACIWVIRHYPWVIPTIILGSGVIGLCHLISLAVEEAP